MSPELEICRFLWYHFLEIHSRPFMKSRNQCDTLLRHLGRALLLSLLLVASLGFCGCSTVKPELTPEERAYNEQLRLQGGNTAFYHGAPDPAKSADKKFSEKVVDYLCFLPMAFLYALGNSNASFKP
jgi:hypothetical protein